MGVKELVQFHLMLLIFTTELIDIAGVDKEEQEEEVVNKDEL